MFDSFRQSTFARFRQKKSLMFMNLAQFGAIVNDNIYKLTMVFLLIEALGSGQASTILSKAGATFVIPFLLFSSAAGVLADRFSKKWILSVMKVFEICIFLTAIPVFFFKNSVACYSLLFLLATHSAIFGPSKYGIIPELVTKEAVPKANGLITSTTYLAIIIGTFLGSFLTQITHRHYTFVMIFCSILAALGLLCALSVPRTPRQGSTKKVSPFFFVEVYQTVLYCKQYRHLRIALIGSAFFLFIGAYTQLAIIPYTIQSLGLPEEMGGYLFLCTALGIAIGAFLAGRVLKKKIDLFLPCATAYILFLLLEALFIFSGHTTLVIVSLILLGIAGGLFVVPIDSFIQLSCPPERRGQVIGACNFLGFCGVLVASFCLYFFSEILGMTTAMSFGVIGIITLVFAIGFSFRLSDVVVAFLAKVFARSELRLRNVKLFTESKEKPLLILQHGTWRKFFYLARVAPDYHFILFEKTKPFYKILSKLCYHLHLAPASSDALLKEAETLHKAGYPVCVILPHIVSFDEQKSKRGFLDFFRKTSPTRLYVDIQMPLSSKGATEVTFSEE